MVFALAACSHPAPPNVLLVTFDTTRYDRFGCTGDSEAHTPAVDALAARGLLFTRAYASVALTLPSHATMLTGLFPFTHGARNNGRFRMPDEVESLAERLHDAGYDTAAFVSAFVLDRRYHLNQGFDVYSDKTHRTSGPLNFTVPQRPGEEVSDEAIAWLRERPDNHPFFLWAHYYDPHQPRDVRSPFDMMPDAYAAEIAYADAQFARLLDEVQQHAGDRGTLIVFTADHGESFGEHGEETHGLLAYDATLHVPLIVAGRGVPAGVRSDAFASHVDIVPTVLEAVGRSVPRGLPGRNLLRAARSGSAGDDAVVASFECQGPRYDLGWAGIDGVRTGRWKYTAAPAPAELYDTIADPKESRNRIADEPEVAAKMERLRARLQKDQAAKTNEPSARPTLSLEDMERLAALGYVEAPGSFASGREPDPRRFVRVFGMVDGARGRASAGRYDEAIEALETLAKSEAVRPLVLRSLAPVYAERGRYDEAIAAYQEYIRLTDAREARLGLARVYLDAGRPAEALRFIEALSDQPPGLVMLRAYALGRLGRLAEARDVLDAAFASRPNDVQRLGGRAMLVIDVAPIEDGEHELRQLLASAPDDAQLKSWLGYYLAVWGKEDQHDEAMQLLQAAARAEADDARLQANLGWGAHRAGHDAEARQALEKALALDSGRQLERFRLAVVLQHSGEPDQALALARAALAARPAAEWAEDARKLVAELEATVR